MDHLTHKDLTPGQNNVWYEYNDSEDVVVFVHGFFSESAGAWLYENKLDHTKDQFWPDLIRSDARLANPSLFLGGYHSTLDSGNYGFDNCADELFSALQRQDEQGHPPVLDKPGIVFVCHSMGGIVVRYVLERHREAFEAKRVGLVLIASPSYGSVHADRLAWLAALYNQEQGLHLKWGDALLQDLDSRFKDLVDSRTIRDLVGVEACENYFILHRKWLPDRNIVVTEESAGRYFGAAKMLRGTDHFTAIKPDGPRHPTHELIVDFWQRYVSLKSQGPQDAPAAPSPAGPPSPGSTISAGQNGVSASLPSEETRHSNLPAQVNSFVGREGAVEQVKTLLGTSRLVTLTGPGGVGKSRLALQVAGEIDEQYTDGVWLVEMAALSDPSLVVQAVASVLGVREVAGEALAQTLASQLKPKKLLLVLDNCEHLLEACGRLCDGLLSACPQVRVLATSRERLNITGEQVFPVPSLATPDPTAMPPFENLIQMEAVRLFQDRAAAAQPSFSITPENASSVAQVCWRLDGIPLAIELAAARVPLLTVQQIADRLDDRFRLLTDGSRTALPRQQTLRALIDWSYDLLSDHEKTVLQRLSVFVGGWTLEAAEAVCGDDGIDPRDVLNLLGSLSEKSLVVTEPKGDAVRYRLLETIRQYAQERLQETEEAEGVRTRHWNWCLKLALEAEPQLNGPDQARWLNRLEAEHDNFRAALAWSQETANRLKGLQQMQLLAGLLLSTLLLGEALGQFWEMRGFYSEGRQWLGTILAWGDAAQPWAQDQALYSQARAGVLFHAGSLASCQRDYASAQVLFGEASAFFRQSGNKVNLAASLTGQGSLASDQGDYASAKSLYEEALVAFRESKNPMGVAFTLINLGNVALGQDDPKARGLYEEGLADFRALDNPSGVALSLINLGNLARSERDFPSARGMFEESLALYWRLGNQAGIDDGITRLGFVAFGQDQHSRAAKLFGAAEKVREALGSHLAPNQQETYDKQVSTLREVLGEDGFASTWSGGRAMTQEQAVEYALKGMD